MLDATQPLNPRSHGSRGYDDEGKTAVGAVSGGNAVVCVMSPSECAFHTDIREMTDAAQSMDVACVHLDKMQFFYVSTLMFALPILYSCADQIWGQTLPNYGYFDGCILSDGTTGTFEQCVACNGGDSNLVNLTPSVMYGADVDAVLRVGLILASLVGWSMLFTSYVRYARYVRRALNLLAYGVYIVPPRSVGKVLALNVPVTLSLVGIYVYGQVVSGLFEVSVTFGAASPANQQGPCTAIFNAGNPTVAAPPTTFRTIGSTVLTMVALYSPSIVSLVRMYASPYASVSLSNLVVEVKPTAASGEKLPGLGEAHDPSPPEATPLEQQRQQPYHVGVASTIVQSLRVSIQLDVVESYMPQFMNENGIRPRKTLADYFLYVFGIGHTPSQDVFCDQWGDDEATVAAFVEWCGSKGLLGTVDAAAQSAELLSSSATMAA